MNNTNEPITKEKLIEKIKELNKLFDNLNSNEIDIKNIKEADIQNEMFFNNNKTEIKTEIDGILTGLSTFKDQMGELLKQNDTAVIEAEDYEDDDIVKKFDNSSIVNTGGKAKKARKTKKRKGNAWTDLVTDTYNKNKHQKNYTFKKAIKDAKKVYKKV
jgi:hypothetical protein